MPLTQVTLRRNCAGFSAGLRGRMPREGSALLQGRLLCGKCGSRMRVHYENLSGQLRPYYRCTEEVVRRAGKPCQWVHGLAVDEAVGALLLQTVAPAAIEVADPHRLILLLFSGAQAAIGNARAAMQQQQIAAKGEAISKAIDIIGNGLKVSLDLEKGGEIAERLDALYDYLVLRLLRANLNNDLHALEEVSGLLEEIHSAWRDISPNAVQQAVA